MKPEEKHEIQELQKAGALIVSLVLVGQLLSNFFFN